MSADELRALAERCEQATGPTFDLFEDAFALCFPQNYMPGRSGVGPFRWSDFKAMLDASAWLDAALTLVPKGWEFIRLEQSRARPSEEPDGWRWVVDMLDPFTGVRVRALTQAGAVVAAALRARAQSSTEHPND